MNTTDTGKGRLSVTDDIEAVLRKIEYWHQGSIGGFTIKYRIRTETGHRDHRLTQRGCHELQGNRSVVEDGLELEHLKTQY